MSRCRSPPLSSSSSFALKSCVNVRNSRRRRRPSSGKPDICATGLLGEIDEATFIELLRSHLGSLTGEAEEPSELGDVHLFVENDRFESSVLGEGDPERLERLIHEYLHAVLKAADGGDDLPTGREAVVVAHRTRVYMTAVTRRDRDGRRTRAMSRGWRRSPARSRLDLSRAYRQTPMTRSGSP